MANINTALKLGFPLTPALELVEETNAFTITATTTAPTPGTGATFYRRTVREGRFAIVRFEFNQTAVGSAGSGSYQLPMPSSIPAIDTTKITVASTQSAVGGGIGSGTLQSNAATYGCAPYYNGGKIYVLVDNQGAAGVSWADWGSASNGLGNTTVRLSVEIRVPIVGWTDNYVSGSGGGGTTYEEVAVSKTAVSGTRYLYNLFAGPYTLTLPGGTTAATVSFQDRAGLASSTKYLRIDPGASNSIDSFNNGDTVDMDYANFSGTVNRAAGSSVWYRVKQLTSTVQPGAQSGYNGGNAIAAGYIGEVITWAVSPSTLVLTTSLADWPNATLALTAGVWLIRADVQAQAATGTTSGNNTYSVAQLTDSANNVIQGNSSRVDATTAGAASTLVGATISLSALVNISASASYKIRGMKVDNVGTGSGQLRNQSDAFSRFFAVRIA